MKEPKNTKEAQGAEIVPERQPSLSYTIKSLGGNIKKLKQLKAVNDTELTMLIETYKTLRNKYIGMDLEL